MNRLPASAVVHKFDRRELVPGMASLQDAACVAGAYAATLSGSGRTLVAVSPQEVAERVADAMMKRWRAEGVVADSFVQRRPAMVG
jgi:homoserine kinase